MGTDAPQWLFSSFVEAMQEIGATACEAELVAEARDLADRWNEPTRHFHTVRHLINVLAHIDELSQIAHDPDVLRVSAWYHGAVLNLAVEAQINGAEPTSIARACVTLATRRLVELGVSDDVAVRVGELITLLAVHKASPDDVDAQVLIDAELADLAATPQDYKKYRATVRAEYSQVDDATFYQARRIVLKRLLAKPKLFYSPIGAQEWEERARQNLEGELAKTEEAMAKIDPTLLSGQDPTLDQDMTSTGTIIIRRRHLKKNPCKTADTAEDTTTTGILPALKVDEQEVPVAVEDSGDASSLEMAADLFPPDPLEK